MSRKRMDALEKRVERLEQSVFDNPKPPRQYCCMPLVAQRDLSGIDSDRARLILATDKKWVSGTVLRYQFIDGSDAEQNAVREAFRELIVLGIGLDFLESTDAEIRIRFQRGAGSWSYLGRDCLNIPDTQPTMNFGWDIVHDYDTCVHEVLHSLGFAHEHQNPNAGIVWNENAVYRDLSGPPNNWDRDTIHYNVLRKIPSDEVFGSTWDANSIMHYPIAAGWIEQPERYRDGLWPSPGLSEMDIEYLLRAYPPEIEIQSDLKPYECVQFDLQPGEQTNFQVVVDDTREYKFSTFGDSDVVMVLFDEDDKKVAANDDSGYDTNAYFKTSLNVDHVYTLRIRMYWQEQNGQSAVMLW